MSIILPNSVNYKEGLPSLPEGTQSINVSASPINGQTFSGGQQIMFDLLNRGFLVPDSMYISYGYTLTKDITSSVSSLIGCPIYTSFSRVDLQIGSQTVETIQSYNVLMTMLSNLTLSVAEKYGLQASFGYQSANTPPNLEELDGCLFDAGTGTSISGTFAGPLMTMLSNSEKLIPLFAMPQVRLILNVENINNMFLFSGIAPSIVPTNWTLSNVELRYKIVDMGSSVEDMVRGMGDKIYIKSQSFACSSNTLQNSNAGTYELIYNQRFASMKSIFCILGNSIGNKIFDSVDLTSSNGEYSWGIGGQIYPSKPLNTKTNKAGILQELRTAVGSIFDKNNSFSINSLEWNRSSAVATTSLTAPAKFYLGTSLEKLNSASLLTGISSQNSPISFRFSTGTPTGGSSTITLIVNYDALIEVDLVNRQCSVKT